MNFEKLMTDKEKSIVYKRQRIAELRLEGLTHEKVWHKLNEELTEMGYKTVSLSYIYKYWSKTKSNK